MKILFSTFILLMFSLMMFSQKKCSKKDIPLFLNIVENENLPIYARTRVEVYDTHLIDTLRVVFFAVVKFEGLSKDILLPAVKNISVDELAIRKNNGMRKSIRSENVKNMEDQYIWDLCSKYIIYWCWNQPYVRLQERIYDELYLGGTFYIIPTSSEAGCEYKVVRL